LKGQIHCFFLQNFNTFPIQQRPQRLAHFLFRYTVERAQSVK
jgi:hypothetical protein